MTIISAQKAIEILKQGKSLEDFILNECFSFVELQDVDFEVKSNLIFINCVFKKKISTFSGYHREDIVFKGCVFYDVFSLHAIFTYKKLLIDGCTFHQYAAINNGGFYGGIILKDNIFEDFADFEDQDIRGNATFINNKFLGGTNLAHPKGGPHGAHFTHPPHLEGNTGLEQYEKGKRSSW